MSLTAERLREVLSYDPETGLFTRIGTTKNQIKARSIAGSLDRGRLRARVDGTLYLLHRLAWLYVYGKWPDNHIDHINGIPSDNRIANLRDVSRSINLQNQRKGNSLSKTGLLGVHPHRNKYQAEIRVNGRIKYLGLFTTPEEAFEAYVIAKRQFHPGNTL